MIKRFNEFVNEGWAAGSIKRASGGRNIRKEDMPDTKEQLREIIIKRIEEEGNECDLNDIDVSRIKDMSFLFCAGEIDEDCEKPESEWIDYFDDIYPIFKEFNGDISGWDVSNVTNMKYMFNGCNKFNCDIGGWDVSSVKDMGGMFCCCEEFDQDIRGWNVSNVTDMHAMFYGCDRFNHPLGDWNVLKVEDMKYMFFYCGEFDQDISRWDVSNVGYMNHMFYKCEKFNQDISGWNIKSLVFAEYMFSGCSEFKQKGMEKWGKYKIDNTFCMFEECPKKPSWCKNENKILSW